MTGSELAGHRLLESARHVVLRTTLLARRGGLVPPLKRPPPPALRVPPAPSGGGQSVAIGPGRRDRRVSLRPVYGICGLPGCETSVQKAVTSRDRDERGRASKNQKADSDVLKRARLSEGARPAGRTRSPLTLPRPDRAG